MSLYSIETVKKMISDFHKFTLSLRSTIIVLSFLTFCIGISALETVAYKIGGNFSILASRVWIILGFFYLGSSVLIVKNYILEDFRKKEYLGWLAITIVLFITLWRGSSFQFINHEATQQIAAAFNNTKELDLHYTKTSFLGYPSRQYLISALPSLIIGKGPSMIAFGYAFPFILGLIVFYVGLMTYLKNGRYGNYFSALAVISIMSFPDVPEFLLRYEQAIFPISFTLQATGWFLIFISKITIFKAMNLMWVGSLLATIYTPGLGSWILLLIFILILTLNRLFSKRNYEGFILLCCLVVILTFGINSFLNRNDFVKPNGDLKIVIEKIIEGYRIFFLSEKKIFTSPVLLLPVVIYLSTSILRMNGSVHFLISLWTILVVGVSVSLKGYANPPPSFGIHRALIVIPPLISGLTLMVSKIMERNFLVIKKLVFYFLFMIIALFSFWNFYEVIRNKLPDLRLYLLEDMTYQMILNKIDLNDPVDVLITTNRNELVSVGDFLMYFFPDHKLTISNNCLLNLDHSKNTIFYFENSICEQQLAIYKKRFLIEKFVYEKNNDNYEMTRVIYKLTN